MHKREILIHFSNLVQVTGERIAAQICSDLKSLELDIKNIRGQGYDGASNMSSDRIGVQAHIRKESPLAVYTHCSGHFMNLVISHSSSIPIVRNVLDKMKVEIGEFGAVNRGWAGTALRSYLGRWQSSPSRRTGNPSEARWQRQSLGRVERSWRAFCLYFLKSPKRNELLIEIVTKSLVKRKPLIDKCKTRWAVRHSAYQHFYQCCFHHQVTRSHKYGITQE